MKRSEMNKDFMWDMTDMYVDDEAWEKEFQSVKDMIKGLSEYTDKMNDGADALLALLNYNLKLSEILEKLYVYANQKSHEDMSVGKYQDMCGRISNLIVKYETVAAQIVPCIMAMGQETVNAYITECDALKLYDRYFEIIFRKEGHILDADKEELLAGVGEISETPSDIFAMFNNADCKFEDVYDSAGNAHVLTHATFTAYLQGRDRVLRENAFLGMYSLYERYRNTLAATYSGNLKQHNFFARVRNYDSGMHYSLSESGIPVEVYNRLIDAAHANIGLLHKYVSVRKEHMKLSKLHMYDLYVPLVEDYDIEIDYEEAKNIVLSGLAPLGGDYLQILKEGFDGGWIDVYENEGKRSGAYSWGVYSSHPYVLLNHQNNLNSVFTLAHEMGHALHTYFSNATQPYLYSEYKIFVAEVASTCNEALLVNYLINNAKSDKEKKYLINYFLEQCRTTFFRQTMFAEFEKITHEKCAAGETLTADVLCGIYKELNEFYYGPDIVVDDEIAMEWARIPHFYNPFYVYQYATGFAAAVAISTEILAGNEDVLLGYRQFLKGGSSLDPIDLLKLAGVDMCTEKPVDMAMKMFGDMLNKFIL